MNVFAAVMATLGYIIIIISCTVIAVAAAVALYEITRIALRCRRRHRTRPGRTGGLPALRQHDAEAIAGTPRWTEEELAVLRGEKEIPS